MYFIDAYDECRRSICRSVWSEQSITRNSPPAAAAPSRRPFIYPLTFNEED